MKHYISLDGVIHAFDDDVNAGDFIDLDSAHLMTDLEVDMHYFPEKYLSAEEKALLNRKYMPTLTPIEFDLKLADHGLYDDVQALIATNLQLKIAYTRATFFSRTDPFIDQARIALNLTDEQIDEMWLS